MKEVGAFPLLFVSLGDTEVSFGLPSPFSSLVKLSSPRELLQLYGAFISGGYLVTPSFSPPPGWPRLTQTSEIMIAGQGHGMLVMGLEITQDFQSCYTEPAKGNHLVEQGILREAACSKVPY